MVFRVLLVYAIPSFNLAITSRLYDTMELQKYCLKPVHPVQLQQERPKERLSPDIFTFKSIQFYKAGQCFEWPTSNMT